jgi:DNA-binding transcriptional ArsR family regulator
MHRVFRDNRELKAEELNEQEFKALDNKLRRNILRILAEKPSYPAEISKKLDVSKQKIYYHFRKLKESGIIVEKSREKKSGGLATYYQPAAEAFVLDTGAQGRKTFVPADSRSTRRFLNPLISHGDIQGNIVVGSSQQHGPDQVRARDGHLAGDIAVKLGNHGEVDGDLTVLDTELSRVNGYDRNLLIIGGILTNTVAKKFNGKFPVKFTGESFPYREITTPRNSYESADIGFVAKTVNPENPEKAIYIVAGVRNQGTVAAVHAFQDLETILEDYKGGEFYTVVRGLDMNGDGRIDDYEVIE